MSIQNIKSKMYEIIFEADTPAGKAFDILLILLVLLSVFTVILESVESFEAKYFILFGWLEWIFTVFFTIEFGLRVFCAPKPMGYIFSFFGLIDLFAILPTYLGFFLPGLQNLLIIRAFRLLRVFRVLKLSRYSMASRTLSTALHQSRPKITVFLSVVLTLVVIVGALMYLVEGRENGFTSIPKSIYWAIVTMTTVGYGDIAPSTTLGQIIASILMIAGYGIIAVPTGIVTSELTQISKGEGEISKKCPQCLEGKHVTGAKFCSHCGNSL